MVFLLVFLLVVMPIAELYVLIQVGRQIGALETIALLILASILGAALLRSQGRVAWRRFAQALAEGRVPGREVIDGALVILGGTLLLAPGFLSDVVGLLLLLPPTRTLVRALVVRTFAARLVAVASSGGRSRVGRILMFEPGSQPRDDGTRSSGAQRSPRPSSVDDDVVEGTGRDVPPPRRDLP